MMLTVAQRKTLIQAALGRERLDLKLADVQLVNVYTGRIEPASLGIKAGRIVTLDAQAFDAETTVDAQGLYALPGFIDTHIHVDSTLIVPENLAELIVPGGSARHRAAGAGLSPTGFATPSPSGAAKPARILP